VENQTLCKSLFRNLCVNGWSGRQQVGISGLLMSLFGGQPWWGEFLADTMVRLFSGQNMEPFPQERSVYVHFLFV
jgi:hypothetical protein